MKRVTASVLVGFLGLAGLAAVPTAQAAPLPAAKTCSGVWVVVDYGRLGGITASCASDYGTGTKALRSANLKPTLDNGMIVKIKDKPSKVDIQKEYWSYWHATQNSDGSWGSWKYSDLGANSSRPRKGVAEGWRFQALSDGKVAPGGKPPKAVEEPTKAPTPKPTKSSSTPTTKPSKKPSTSSTPSRSTTPTATSSSRPSSATPTRTPSATPSSASPAASATPTESEAEVVIVEESPGPLDTTAAPEPPSDAGSPVGALVTGGLVLLAGAGAGGWWFVKGRHR